MTSRDDAGSVKRSRVVRSRRQVLLGTGAALSVFVAGCSRPGGEGEEEGGGGEGGEGGGGEGGEGGEGGGGEGGEGGEG